MVEAAEMTVTVVVAVTTEVGLTVGNTRSRFSLGNRFRRMMKKNMGSKFEKCRKEGGIRLCIPVVDVVVTLVVDAPVVDVLVLVTVLVIVLVEAGMVVVLVDLTVATLVLV